MTFCAFFVLVKSYREKNNKKFKTDLITSFILLLTGGKYSIKIIFDIIGAINNWLYADELLYLHKLF